MRIDGAHSSGGQNALDNAGREITSLAIPYDALITVRMRASMPKCVKLLWSYIAYPVVFSGVSQVLIAPQYDSISSV
jgi:hypothetical protein